MRSYRFAKKFTCSTFILFSILFLSNLTFLFLGRQQAIPTKNAKASESCTIPADVNVITSESNNSYNIIINIQKKSSVNGIEIGNVDFNYYFMIEGDGTTYLTTNTNTMISSLGDLPFNALNLKAIDSNTYQNGDNNSFFIDLSKEHNLKIVGYFTVNPGADNACEGSITKENIRIGGSSGSINIQSIGDYSYYKDGSGNLAAPVIPVNFSFSGYAGYKYQLSVSDCSGTYWSKQIDKTVPADGTIVTYNWTPDSVQDKSCKRNVKITVNSNSQIATLCLKNTSGDDCGDIASDSDGSSSTTDANLSEDDITPDSVDACEDKTSAGCVLVTAFALPKKITGVGDIVNLIVKLLLYIVGVLGFIGLAVGGIQLMSSAGDMTKAAKAKKTIIYSVAGILLASFALVIQAIAANFWSGPS